MNQYDQHRLKINENPYRTICHSLGGIHKAIQILEMLTPRTEFFAISANRDEDLKPHHIKQYCFTKGNIKMLSPYSRVWCWLHDKAELCGLGVYQVNEFLDGLEHAINHGVFVPENIYFQTMDRITLLRGDKNQGDQG
jgi:hypothetical protein